MSEDEPENGDADGEAADDAEQTDYSVEELRDRLEELQELLDAAETEADLDDVEADVESLEADVEASDLPEPDDEDEDAPEEELVADIEDVQSDLEEARGPYAEDVASDLGDVASTVADTRWTEDGHEDVLAAVETFVDDAGDALDDSFDVDDEEPEALADALEAVADAIESAGLDADDDAELIATLLEATETLQAAVEDAEEWDDLSIREQLDYHGVYDQVDHRKDFPPEWHALKVYEKNFDAEGVLVVLDRLDSDFMERHCMEVLEKLGPEEALDEMSQRAQRRDKAAIRILGKIGSEEPVETLVDYVDADSDPELQKATFRALGEIGTEEATQPIANKLVADSEDTRSRAARALGLIGDTRAISPLADVLADEDEADRVRASAAWALNQIGTEAALEEVSGYVDDRAFIVQAEAEKVA
ncbi:HEAT repeat domain-containing protein [Halorubellus litoreus]|uniref:HEAT repeat domain-containing protein n=1 Tax=Halorubellus litoreus TaxID=755308 RepID=A0ABD5VKZ3_9EURY